MKRLALCLSAIAAFASYTACSDDDGVNTGVCNPACGEGKVCKDGTCVTAHKDAGSGDDADGGDIIVGQPDTGTVQPKVDAGSQTCAAERTSAQQLPLDMFLMLDQSGSMVQDKVANGSTKWAAVTAALSSFFSQSNLSGTSVGIQYFPLKSATACSAYDNCSTDSDCGPCGPCESDYYYGSYCVANYTGDTCTASDYAKPAVEIAALPGAAAAINASIAGCSPAGATPTAPALQGAIDHAKSWALQNPQHVVIALLATDGDPTECYTGTDPIPAIKTIAQAGASGTPKILTFVIGVGKSLSALNGIAASGGTTSATLVDTGGDVNAQLIAAMNAIRGAALGCTYKIPVPSSGTPDFTKVNVQYTPGGTTTPVIMPQAASLAACPTGKDAWYYDNPSAPTQILLCPTTCNKVKADTTGAVDVLLGCQTIIN